jgi:hypothetical protein
VSVPAGARVSLEASLPGHRAARRTVKADRDEAVRLLLAPASPKAGSLGDELLGGEEKTGPLGDELLQ